MKSLKTANYADAAGIEMEQNGSKFTIKPVVGLGEASKCVVHFVEVSPGNSSFGFHWHEANEEVFYIIKGEGAVRTNGGEIKVAAGDAITFPAGKEGAHCIRNASASETLVYIDFDAVCACDIAHLPDAKKIICSGPYSSGMFDEPRAE